MPNGLWDGTIGIVACDPATNAAPRCRLRQLYTGPDVEVRGYDDDDRIEVDAGVAFTIGRTHDAEVQIIAMIGGRRTFTIYWRAPDWVFHVNNERARVLVDGDRIQPFNNAPLREGTVVEIRHAHTEEPVHRFRVELG